MTGICWECNAEGDMHDHHPVPKSRGGMRTIPLCEDCHGKAHHRDGAMSTSALTRAALQAKKARGEKTGGVCTYGEADGVDPERAAEELAIIARVMELRACGMTIRGIADDLAAAGFKTRRGGYMAPTQVARMIKAKVAA